MLGIRSLYWSKAFFLWPLSFQSAGKQDSRGLQRCCYHLIPAEDLLSSLSHSKGGRENGNTSLQKQGGSSLLMGIPSVLHSLQRLSVLLQAKKKPKALKPSFSAGKRYFHEMKVW